MNPGKDQLISNIIIALPIILGVMIIVLLVLYVNQRKKIRHLRQQRDSQESLLINSATSIEETEKIRFTRFLHNELMTEISAARAKISDIKNSSEDMQEQLMYNNAIGLLDNVITNIQTTTWHLPSNILRKYGLNEAIRYFTSKISDLKKVNASFQLDNSYKNQLGKKKLSCSAFSRNLSSTL